MSKSPQAKAAQNARFQHRVRRDKAAALLMANLIFREINPTPETCQRLAESAVRATDILLQELDRTKPPEANNG